MMKMLQTKTRKDRGFTLIELSIVAIVAGVMMAGASYGFQLYHAAKIKSVYATVSTVKQAYKTFKSKYGSQPGDMPDAQTKLYDCKNNPANSCRNGIVNDNFIGVTNKKINESYGSMDDMENGLFWYHLKQAGLIEGIDAKIPIGSSFEWGKSVPEVAPAGGLIVRAINQDICYASGTPADMVGVWLVWQYEPVAAANRSLVVSPEDARLLDTTYDDGKPGYGDIRAAGNNDNPALVNDGCRVSLNEYEGAETERRCYMYFRISREIN